MLSKILKYLFLPILMISLDIQANEGLRLNKQSSSKNVVHGTCYNFLNHSNKIDYFIPIYKLPDFDLFLRNKPGEIDVLPCPVDCVGTWGSCISGLETYRISTVQVGAGAACQFTDGETRSCGTVPVDCVGSWGSCIAGTETYKISTDKVGTGKACQFADGDTQACTEDAVDCVGAWGACDATNQQIYTISVIQKGTGQSCEASNNAIRTCTKKIDCIGSFGSCRTDGKKEFTITVPAADGGKACDYTNGELVKDSSCKCFKVSSASTGPCQFGNGIYITCVPLMCVSSNQSQMEAAVDCSSGSPMVGGTNYSSCTYASSFGTFGGKITCVEKTCDP